MMMSRKPSLPQDAKSLTIALTPDNLFLDKDSPTNRPSQRHSQLAALSILCGLHHQYCRM